MGVEPIRADRWHEKLVWYMVLWSASVFNYIRGTMGYKPADGETYRELYRTQSMPKWYLPLAFTTVPVAPVKFHFRGRNSREAKRYYDTFKKQYASIPVNIVQHNGTYFVV